MRFFPNQYEQPIFLVTLEMEQPFIYINFAPFNAPAFAEDIPAKLILV